MTLGTASKLVISVGSLFTNFKEGLSQDILNDVTTRNHFLKSCNFYQDEERDGVDYIFDITDREDVMNTDLEVGEVYDLYNNFIHGKATKYFLCGCNYPTPVQFPNEKEFVSTLIGWVDEVARHILAHPSVCESHYYIYQKYIGGLSFQL